MTEQPESAPCSAARHLAGRLSSWLVLAAALLLTSCSYLESEFATVDRMPPAFARGAPDQASSALTRP